MPEYSRTRFEQRDGRAWIRVIDQFPMSHRYLHFGTSIQGVLDLNHVASPVLEYIGLMVEMAKATAPEPEEVLVGGLGACAIWHAVMSWRGPRFSPDVIESSDLVLDLAKRFFRFKPKRACEPRSLRETLASDKTSQYDLAFIDCYNARFMPANLLTAEFMRLLKARLKADGCAIVNVWNPKCNQICGHQIRTMLEIFGQVGIIAGKEDDNFAICLPAEEWQKAIETVTWKGRPYPVHWLRLPQTRSWPDYMRATRTIYDGNVWQFMRELNDVSGS